MNHEKINNKQHISIQYQKFNSAKLQPVVEYHLSRVPPAVYMLMTTPKCKHYNRCRM